MERARRSAQAGAAPPQPSVQIIYEEFHPSFDWTRDPNAHILLVDLPGFKKEEVKVQVDNSGKLTIAAERKVNESKYIRCKKIFDVPGDADIKKISGKFELGLLFITMPLKEVEKEERLPKVVTSTDAAKKEEKPAQKQEPRKEDAAIAGKDIEKKEVKQEPKKEDAPIGKDSTKKEEKPPQEQFPKKEEAVAVEKVSSKKEEKPKPMKESDGFGKDGAKKEEKPISASAHKEESKEEDGTKVEEKPLHKPKEEARKQDSATAKEGTKEEEKKPMDKPKEEGTKANGIDGSKKDEKPTQKERPAEKEEVGGHKILPEQRRKPELGFAATASKKEDEGGDWKQGWRRERVGRNEKKGEEREAMAIEGRPEEDDLEEGLFGRVLEQVSKHKAIIATAALAFSFGVYLSRKLR